MVTTRKLGSLSAMGMSLVQWDVRCMARFSTGSEVGHSHMGSPLVSRSPIARFSNDEGNMLLEVPLS